MSSDLQTEWVRGLFGHFGGVLLRFGLNGQVVFSGHLD